MTLVISLISALPAQATEDIELELKDPTYLGNASMNILFEIKNNSDKKMDVMTIYSNNEFPARDATVIVGQTYPFVGSLDPYYSDSFKYQVLVRGYLLTEFRYVQGYVKIINKQFRKTGFTTYTNFFSNVVDMRALTPN